MLRKTEISTLMSFLALLIVLTPGCLYDDNDATFMYWVAEKVKEVIEFDAEVLDAMTEQDYDKLEALADIASSKSYEYYEKVQGFSVSTSDGKELKKHATLLFYYHHKAESNLKKYAQYMKELEYETTSYYSDISFDYFDKVVNETKIVEDILSKHGIEFEITTGK